MKKKVNYVLDAEVQGFFDNLDKRPTSSCQTGAQRHGDLVRGLQYRCYAASRT